MNLVRGIGKCRGIRGLILGVSLALFGVSPLHAAVAYDPFYDWRTLETPHFRIHFKQQDEVVAQRAAVIAERVHEQLSVTMRWSPEARTEVVLSDEFDLPNGYATPYPYNMMGLFITPPEAGAFMTVDSLDQWLEDLIEHEYAHVLHLDKAAGFPRVWRRIFGRNILSFPNVFQPQWLIEGLATWHETDADQRRGRGQNAEYAMFMRTEVLNGTRSLQTASTPNVTWPGGTVPYLYGVYFFLFLESRYGEDRVQDFVDAYSRNFLPYRINGTARAVFGKDMVTLWSEFEQYLEERYSGQLDAIRAQSLQEGERLTFDGFAARHDGGNLAVMPNGDVYFVRGDGRQRPALMQRRVDGSVRQRLKLNPGARISVHPDAGILIAQPEVCRERRVYYDVFLLKHDSGRLRRLTRCARYRDVTWHPAGDRFAAVRFEQGQATLDLLDTKGRTLTTLAQGADDELLMQPDWSPDGERLVLVRTKRGQGTDLFEFLPASQQWSRLTDDINIEFHPRYSPDGNAVLFTSDHGDVYNIRRLDRQSGDVSTLTHAETGAVHPVQASDGSIFYLGYGPVGYDLFRLSPPFDSRALPPAPAVFPEPEPVTAGEYPVRDYSPWQSLAPRSWFPWLMLDEDLQEVGVVTFGQDALGVHSYSLLPIWDVTHGELIGAVSYAWSDRIFAGLSRMNALDRNTDGDLVRVRRHDDAVAAWRIPFTRMDRAWNVYLGGALDRERELMTGAGFEPLPDLRDDLYGVALLYRNSHWLRLSFSEQEGRRVKLVAERSLEGSDYSGDVYTLDWREYFHLGNTHVLGFRYVHGWGEDDPRPFRLGGARGTGFTGLLTAGVESTFNQRRYGLRGYSEGHPAMQGRRMQLATLEYRFPLSIVERTVTSPPVGIHRWSGNVFMDAGAAWNEERPSRLHPGAGFEAVLDANAGYGLIALRLRIGYAHGFDRDAGGRDQLYLSVGSSF